MIENQNSYPMNLLVTLDRNYVPQLNVMLFSALQSDPAAFFDVYILHDEGLSASDLTATRALLAQRYRERYPLYRAAADAVLAAVDSREDNVKALTALWRQTTM